MHKDGKQYDKFILNGKTYEKFYLNNKIYGKAYTPFATPILDLDFQNNFVDKSPSAITMVQGQGLPTFGLSGRKTGEYCANFNGSQSIKTTTNLPLNSDKVCVKFWMKTSQTLPGLITELSDNYNNSNSFCSFVNGISQNKIDNSDHTTGGSNYNLVSSSIDINNNSWVHVIITIDRSLGVNQSKIYINGELNFLIHSNLYRDNNGNFAGQLLYIGQRAGNQYGYVGSLMKYQIFNRVPTDAQAMEMYQNDL